MKKLLVLVMYYYYPFLKCEDARAKEILRGKRLHKRLAEPAGADDADAFGHKAFKVSDPAQLDSVVKEALSLKDDLVIVDVITDTDSKVFPMQKVGGSMVDMILSEEDAK